jgi:hypothetical protein
VNNKLSNNGQCLPFYKFLEGLGKEDYIIQEELAQISRGIKIRSRSRFLTTKYDNIMRMRGLYQSDTLAVGGRLANIKAYLRGLTT